MTTRLACRTGAVLVVAAGLPVGPDDTTYLESCRVPKVFLQSTNDEFSPRPAIERLYARVAEPKRLIWIPAADHFFAGALDELEEQVYGLV